MMINIFEIFFFGRELIIYNIVLIGKKVEVPFSFQHLGGFLEMVNSNLLRGCLDDDFLRCCGIEYTEDSNL